MQNDNIVKEALENNKQYCPGAFSRHLSTTIEHHMKNDPQISNDQMIAAKWALSNIILNMAERYCGCAPCLEGSRLYKESLNEMGHSIDEYHGKGNGRKLEELTLIATDGEPVN